jgi:hypothetical protein
MVKTVQRECRQWPPDKIGGLFVDNDELDGLIYLYEDIIQVNNEIKALNNKPKP